MKRTMETLLIVVGMIVYGFFALLGAVVIWIQNNREKVEDLLQNSENAGDGFSFEEFEAAINQIGNSGWIFTTTLLVAVILGIVALILLRGKNMPRQAGIVLSGSAVILTIVVGVGAGTGGIFYLIAGLMCFFRTDDVTGI